MVSRETKLKRESYVQKNQAIEGERKGEEEEREE
jgi:hypothetical protein